MTVIDLERIRKFSDGAKVIFENAEALYNEAQTLGQAGSFARAASLHQISMEECAKIDILGVHATSILMGAQVDEGRLAKSLRKHEVKNFANAYYAEPNAEEKSARGRGDTKAASEAFEKLQQNYHRDFSAIKNAGLYVEFEGGKFISPRDVVPEEAAAAMMYINAEFLRRASLFIRLFERMLTEPDKQSEFAKRFAKLMEELRQGGASPDAIGEYLAAEIKVEAKARSREK
jgi:AbiV family abortive infection protein